MEREQVIKALEYCINNDLCDNCPIGVSKCHILEDALTLNKELTEEKEKLGFLIDEIVREKRELFEENKGLIEEVESLKQCMEHEHASFMETFGELDDKCKMLTEENENLHASCTELTRKLECANLEIECKEHICESYAFQYGTVVDKNFWLKKEREATIQKYREALYRAFAHFDSNDKFNKKVFLEVVDQIAKEMVEGV